jgi:tetratricopeptide (TPR) repeat protein
MSQVGIIQSKGTFFSLVNQNIDIGLPVLALFLLGVLLLIALGYILRRRQLVNRYNAPDYQTAKRIRKLKLDSYTELINAENRLNELINEAKVFEKRGRLLFAAQQYEKIIKDYKEYIDSLNLARYLFRIARIHNEMGMLNSEYTLFKQFPRELKDPIISGLYYMLQALIAESEENYGIAKKAWNEAQFHTVYLGVEYKAIYQGYLVNADFREWISNPILPDPDRLIFRLNEWKNLCETHNLYDSLCQVYLMHARISLATYKFQEAETWFKRLLELSEKSNFIHYHDLALKEIELYESHKARMVTLFEARTQIPKEEQRKELIAYIQKARRISQDYWSHV